MVTLRPKAVYLTGCIGAIAVLIAIAMLVAPESHPRRDRAAEATDARVAPPLPTGRDYLSVEEGTQGLRETYSALSSSARPSERAHAYEIWKTCVPTFMGGGSQRPSLDRAVSGLPAAAQYDLQRKAYADLYNQCAPFFSEANDVLIRQSGQLAALQANGEMSTLASRAKLALSLGDRDESLAWAESALASRDPQEMFDLAGLTVAFLNIPKTRSDEIEATSRDAALALAACQMGLDCSAGSLVALRLCAFEGFCDADGLDRIRRRFGHSADRSSPAATADTLLSGLFAQNFRALQYFRVQVD